MRSVPKGVLVLAVLALPVAAVLISFALTDSPRPPRAPEIVQVGSDPGPDPARPTFEAPPGETPAPPPANLPPPAPHDDDDDDDRDDDDG